jgi:hypothetical protein
MVRPEEARKEGASVTKTEMRKLAREARRTGYYKSRTYPIQLYVRCPLCREKVYAQDFAYGTVNGIFKRLTETQMLDAAMVHHLQVYCDETIEDEAA